MRDTSRLRRDVAAAARRAAAVFVLALALSGVASGALASSAAAQVVFATDGADKLLTFDAATPGTIISSTPITGQGAGEEVEELDFRPATGQLYAKTRRAFPFEDRIYTINPATGVATQVGTTPVSSGFFSGLDFNPTSDRLRFVNTDDDNLSINPNDGVATAQTNLAYAAGDPNAGQNPNVEGAAYTNNFAGASSTTLYDIDSDLDVLTIQSPIAAGTLNTVGALGINADGRVGFDIRSTGTAYAALDPVGATPPGFYTINLATGAATLVGQIGGSGGPAVTQPIRGIAVALSGPPPPPVTPPSLSSPSAGGPGGGGPGPTCAGRAATIVAVAGRTTLGTARNDVIVGGSGPDRISGGGGRDLICSGSGNDRVSGGSANDRIFAGSGKDRVAGGSGNDRLFGGSGKDRIGGGRGNDTIVGESGKDSLFGDAGNDRLFGGSGADSLLGGSGRDGLSGGKGKDLLRGGPGRDRERQ